MRTSWWHHQMETFSALLAICAGNSPVPGEFPARRPVTRSFDVFFDLRLNKHLSKQSGGWWFETLSRPLWRHRNVIYCCLLSVDLPISFGDVSLLAVNLMIASWPMRQPWRLWVNRWHESPEIGWYIYIYINLNINKAVCIFDKIYHIHHYRDVHVSLVGQAIFIDNSKKTNMSHLRFREGCRNIRWQFEADKQIISSFQRRLSLILFHVGCTPLLMTYFTEENHKICDRGEARGRLLLAKVVGCYIPCSIDLYGCIGYIHCRNGFSITFVLVCMGNKKYCYFHEIQFPKWRWCQIRRHNFLHQWLTPVKPSWECCPKMGLPGYNGWNDW